MESEGIAVLLQEVKGLGQGREKRLLDRQSLLLGIGCRYDGSDTFGEECNVLIISPGNRLQRFLGLPQRQEEALLHLRHISADFFRKAAVLQPDHLISLLLHEFSPIVQKRLIAGIADAGEQNGQLLSISHELHLHFHVRHAHASCACALHQPVPQAAVDFVKQR